MKIRLYRYQYLSVAVLFCLSNIFLPGIVARTVGKSVYPAFLPGYVLGLLLVLLHTAAFGKSSGGICAVAKVCLGKIGGSAVGVVYVLYFLLIGCELLSFYGLYISGEESVSLYLAPIVLAVMMAGGKSTTVLGRAALIFMLFALTLAVPLGISGFIAGKAENLRAFTCASWEEIGRVALALGTVGGGQLIAVMAISPAKDRGGKNSLLAAALSNGVVLLIALTSLLIEGQTPLLDDVRYFSYTAKGGLSELMILAEAVLFFCAVFRIAVCLRAASCTAAELFALPDERPLAPAFGVLLFAAGAGFSRNIAAVAEYLLRFAPLVSVLPLLILPLLLWLLHKREVRA